MCTDWHFRWRTHSFQDTNKILLTQVSSHKKTHQGTDGKDTMAPNAAVHVCIKRERSEEDEPTRRVARRTEEAKEDEPREQVIEKLKETSIADKAPSARSTAIEITRTMKISEEKLELP